MGDEDKKEGRLGSVKKKLGGVKEKVKERSYKEDGSGLTKVGIILKYGISYVIFSTISIVMLFLGYSPLYDWLYTEVPPMADMLSTPIFFFSIGQWAIIGGGLLVGAIILMIEGWKKQIGVLVLFIIFGIVFMVVFSNIPALSSLLSGLGDPTSILYQFLGLNYPSSTGTEVSFVGLKSYDTIGIELGSISYEGGEPNYKVTEPIASPSEDIKSNFRLPIHIKNLNEISDEGGGLSITNIAIGTGKDREGEENNLELKDTHVWAYANRTSGRRVNDDPSIFLFEAQQIGPICNGDFPCNLGPGEEKTIFAENFVGGDKKAMSYGWVDGCIYPYGEDDCPVSYQNRIPCEDKNMQSFEFEIKIKYDSSVTHTRTLVIADTESDGRTASRQGAIVDISKEVPTDGPVDLIINFDSPYILEEMQAIQDMGASGGNIIKMTVSVQNGNDKGKYRPYRMGSATAIIIEPIGDTFPSWISVVGENNDCTLSGNQIKISRNKFYLPQDQFLTGSVSFVCDLEIDIAAARSDIEGYKSVSFVGNLTYNYIEEKTFFGYRNSVDINREQLCPKCPYPNHCAERSACGEDGEYCIEKYYCPNAKDMCCCSLSNV